MAATVVTRVTQNTSPLGPPLREAIILFANKMGALKNEHQLAKSCREEDHSARPLMKVL